MVDDLLHSAGVVTGYDLVVADVLGGHWKAVWRCLHAAVDVRHRIDRPARVCALEAVQHSQYLAMRAVHEAHWKMVVRQAQHTQCLQVVFVLRLEEIPGQLDDHS